MLLLNDINIILNVIKTQDTIIDKTENCLCKTVGYKQKNLPEQKEQNFTM